MKPKVSNYSMIRHLFIGSMLALVLLPLRGSAQIGSYQPNTLYNSAQNNIRYTNRLFNKTYQVMPSASSCTEPGYITGEFWQPYGSYSGSASCSSCSSYNHKGLDQGTKGCKLPLYAPLNGTVTAYGGATGKICIYNKTYDFTWILLHCSKISTSVTVGTSITAGQYLGDVGDIGAPGNIHAHTEIRKGKHTAAACPCNSTSNSVYDPRIVVNLFTPTYTAVNTLTSCPTTSKTSTCGTFDGNTIKVVVSSISNGVAVVTISKCNGTFSSNGIAYVKLGDVCGTVVASKSYSAGASSVSFPVPLYHSSGTLQYWATLNPSTGGRYYANPFSIKATTGFASLTTTPAEELNELKGSGEPLKERMQGIKDINVFPNPITSDNIKVVFESTIEQSVVVKIYDNNGRSVLEHPYSVQVGQNQLDLNHRLPNGGYVISIEGLSIGVSKKIIIQQ